MVINVGKFNFLISYLDDDEEDRDGFISGLVGSGFDPCVWGSCSVEDVCSLDDGGGIGIWFSKNKFLAEFSIGGADGGGCGVVSLSVVFPVSL